MTSRQQDYFLGNEPVSRDPAALRPLWIQVTPGRTEEVALTGRAWALSVIPIARLLLSNDHPFHQSTRQEVDMSLGHRPSDVDRRKFAAANASALSGV
ncbi:hypothetical protein [Amycolatopsis sp. cmx-4-54]|uniref:hypothetical protein n=1 Tax=Amycolatopsis sp. cmx-4-54 TaxID=2790936 RepID=UPI003977FA4C